jgi:hypothetical protein
MVNENAETAQGRRLCKVSWIGGSYEERKGLDTSHPLGALHRLISWQSAPIPKGMRPAVSPPRLSQLVIYSRGRGQGNRAESDCVGSGTVWKCVAEKAGDATALM